MKLTLRIGQHETGTTALQDALLADRSRLRALGILYPEGGWADFEAIVSSPALPLRGLASLARDRISRQSQGRKAGGAESRAG